MQQKRYPKWFAYLLVSSIGLVPLVACSKEAPKDKKGRFAYSLSFDEKGLPVVLDAKGKPIPPKKVEGPVDAKKIVRVRTISVIDVEGSHFILIEIDGRLYRIDLPD
jgi:hypothetical protein